MKVQDSVFEQSCSYRFAAGMLEMVLKEEKPPSLLVKFSDGASDHRPLLIKVQLGLIAVFKILNLDCLVAMRGAPGQSWLNPAERIMSILNIALQNCSTEREEMDKKYEGNNWVLLQLNM